MSAKEELKSMYEQYLTTRAIYKYAKDKGQANRLVYPGHSFEVLEKTIEEQYILSIIGTFEKILFKRIENAYGEIKKVVEAKYDKKQALYKASTLFIKNKDNFYTISGKETKDVLKQQADKSLHTGLDDIIDHRNWLAHGKRPGAGKESVMKIADTYNTLLKIMDEISTK